MKSLILITAAAFLPVATIAETPVRPDGTYEYDKNELQWDKEGFDSPPQIVGGYADLVQRISYPSGLRAPTRGGRRDCHGLPGSCRSGNLRHFHAADAARLGAHRYNGRSHLPMEARP
jgi:hypothetical protein